MTDNHDFLKGHISISKSFCRDLIKLLVLLASDIVCRTTNDREGAENPMGHADPLRYQAELQRMINKLINQVRD